MPKLTTMVRAGWISPHRGHPDSSRRSYDTPSIRSTVGSIQRSLLRDRDVAHAAPDEGRGGQRARVPDIPGACGGAKDRDVGLAVTIVVARDDDVAHAAPGDGREGWQRRIPDIPGAGRGTKDRDVGLAIAVVVA